LYGLESLYKKIVIFLFSHLGNSATADVVE